MAVPRPPAPITETFKPIKSPQIVVETITSIIINNIIIKLIINIFELI